MPWDFDDSDKPDSGPIEKLGDNPQTKKFLDRLEKFLATEKANHGIKYYFDWEEVGEDGYVITLELDGNLFWRYDHRE